MSFEERWDKASAGSGSDNLDAPTAGTYECALMYASAFAAKDGREFIKTSFRVISESERGYEWSVLWLGVSSDDESDAARVKYDIAKQACARLGIDVGAINNLEQLDGALKERVNQYFTVSVSQNGRYRNTSVVGGVEEVPADAGEPVAAVLGDSDIPF